MLRDMHGSYYTNEPGQGFLADKNKEAAGEIYDQTKRLLNEPHNQLPRGFPDKLRDDLLFKLRSMAFVTYEPDVTAAGPSTTTSVSSEPATNTTSVYVQSVGGVTAPVLPEEAASAPLTAELHDDAIVATTQVVEPTRGASDLVATEIMTESQQSATTDKKRSGRKGGRSDIGDISNADVAE
jgi:hypothetical protein